MLKQVNFFREGLGKTISGLTTNWNDNSVFIAFSDGTFSVLQAQQGQYGEDDPLVANVDFDPSRHAPAPAIQAGVLTAEEFEELREKERRRAIEAAAAWQRQQYERLKAIFEKEDKS